MKFEFTMNDTYCASCGCVISPKIKTIYYRYQTEMVKSQICYLCYTPPFDSKEELN